MKLSVLPLFNEPSYSYTTTLSGKSYTLNVQWNTKASKWFFSIYDENVLPIIEGVALLPNTPLLVDYNLPFGGTLQVVSTSMNSIDLYNSSPRKIAENFYIQYFE